MEKVENQKEKKCPGCKKLLMIERFIEEQREYAKCNTCRLKLVSKKNVCETCGIRAVFHYEGNNYGIRCANHKEPDMIDVKSKMCETCKKKQPAFNYEGEPIAKYCGNCKEPEMINVRDKKCETCKKKHPVFNYEGEPIAKYCGNCKEPEMVNVKNKKCEKCKKKQPAFNYEGEPIAKYCGNCKEPEMINVRDKKCETCKKKRPNFNYEGEQIAKYCSDCKEPDMVNVKSKMCEKCKKKIPTFNYEGESIAKFCGNCKESDMVNVRDKKCEGCKKKRPTFNYEGELIAKYCSDCKEPEMVNVISKKCETCKKKIPAFNYEGEPIAKYCSDCKEPEMIDVKHKKCTELNCNTGAGFGLPGVSVSHCAKHKKEGMLKNPRRRCEGNEEEECKENATYGIKEPIHCEEHATDDEYCLAERKCSRCGNIDILNKEGICVTICSFVEKDKIMKKRVKKHEEFIGKLLEQEIDIASTVIEMWHDSVIDRTCTSSRPDFAYHCGSHIVIVEVDEEQHKSYKNCGHTKEEQLKAENRRMYQIGSIFQGMPIVFLRYNPDNYKDKEGKKGNIPNKKRHDILIRWVKKTIRMKWSEGIHVKYLFYDGYNETDSDFTQITECDII